MCFDTAFAPRLSCSHGYSHELVIFDYTQSTQYSACEPVAFNCDSWESYENGNCNYDCTYDKCQIMALGIQYSDKDFEVVVPNRAMKLFINTTEKEPFCCKILF